MKGNEIKMKIEMGIMGENGTIAIDSLLEMARKIQEEANPELAILREIQEEAEKEISESKMDEFTRIVKGVARKYAIDNFGIERDDLEQDLWVKVFEVINANGGIESEAVNGKLIAKCCWNEAVDKYRYHRRRRDSKAEFTEGSGEDSDSAVSINSSLFHSKFKTGYDEMVIKEVIDLFPRGSKERKYVVTKLYMYGEIDETDVDDELEMPVDDREESVIKLLGYKSKYPASWGAIKGEMRNKIYRYLGKFDEYQSGDKVKDAGKRITQMFKETRNYWIYLNDIKKDEVIKMIGATEEDIKKAVRKDESLTIAIDHTNDKLYLMKNEESYVKHIESLGDRVIL